MAKNATNVHAYNGSNYGVYTAPFGTTPPTTVAGTTPTGCFEVGLLSDQGITEAHSLNDNLVYDLSGALVRDVRNQEQRQFTFEAIEYNAITAGLLYSNSTFATTGATAEIQTVTIAGTGTAGTWNLTVPGVGTLTNLAYNITTANLIAAFLAQLDLTVTVTGTAGTSYVVTFPASFGNPGQMFAVNNITGATGITVATTTPGVQGVNTRGVGVGTGLNKRLFVVDLIDGTVHRRYVINNGEAVQSGSVTYTGSGIAVYQFTLNCYLDSSNQYFQIIDDDPANGETFS